MVNRSMLLTEARNDDLSRRNCHGWFAVLVSVALFSTSSATTSIQSDKIRNNIRHREVLSRHRRAADQSLYYYDSPQLEWETTIDGTMEDGNAIVPSPFDEEILYVTTRHGALKILSASNGTVIDSISPPLLASKDVSGKTVTWGMHCKCAVAFGETQTGKFLVFAVVDEPPLNTSYAYIR